MAKSIRLNDFSENSLTLPQPSGGFWEHWFDTQPPIRTTEPKLDEHGVWEKAIHFGVLAKEKVKS